MCAYINNKVQGGELPRKDTKIWGLEQFTDEVKWEVGGGGRRGESTG